jgi:hypothetical protein
MLSIGGGVGSGHTIPAGSTTTDDFGVGVGAGVGVAATT